MRHPFGSTVQASAGTMSRFTTRAGSNMRASPIGSRPLASATGSCLSSRQQVRRQGRLSGPLLALDGTQLRPHRCDTLKLAAHPGQAFEMSFDPQHRAGPKSRQSAESHPAEQQNPSREPGEPWAFHCDKHNPISTNGTPAILIRKPGGGEAEGGCPREPHILRPAQGIRIVSGQREEGSPGAHPALPGTAPALGSLSGGGIW